MRRAARRLLPPVALDLLRRSLALGVSFSAPQRDWAAARAASGGFDDEAIVRRVADATQAVVDGRAIYERDSVLFDRIQYAFPVVATLLRAALERPEGLNVLDFGGSLGSSYRECRPFIPACVAPLRWIVVEQPAFAACGRSRFTTAELGFTESVSEADFAGPLDVALFSSVLQYLEHPAAAIRDVLQHQPAYVVLDRTIVNLSATDRVHVQRVPARIYRASYPVRSFSEARLTASFEGYELLSAHASLPFDALGAIGSEFKGYIFRRADAQ